MKQVIKETHGGTGFKSVRPNLFLIGVAKSGTTHVAKTLARHPDICLANNKEPTFFSNSRYQKGLEWYCKKYFRHYNDEEYVMDATCDNFHVQYAIPRIKESCIDPKFIVVISEPIVRAYKQYVMYSRWRPGFCEPTFGKEIELNMSLFSYDRFKTEREYMSSVDIKGGCYEPAFIEQGLYYSNISNYAEVFGDDSIAIITKEELYSYRWYFSIIEFLKLKTYGYAPKNTFHNRVISPYPEPCNLKSLIETYPILNKVASLYTSELKHLGDKIGVDLIKKWGYDKL